MITEDDYPLIPEPLELPQLGWLYGFLGRVGGRIFIRQGQRNDPCCCGSGAKVKKCCGEFPRALYVKTLNTINDTES